MGHPGPHPRSLALAHSDQDRRPDLIPIRKRFGPDRARQDHAIRHETLTALAGGEIPISPATGEASEPYFELEAIVASNADISYGITGNILIGSYSEPIGVSLWRSGLRLLQKLEQN